MYIDIILAVIFAVSIYVLLRRMAKKVPDLALIPDQDLSVLLEENTAKLQRFFLHMFHFRSFYRERHYHERFWSIMTKFLFKVHILFLRADNGIMRLMKRMRASNELEVEQRHDTKEYFSQLQERSSLPSAPEITNLTNRMQEVRPRKRARSAKEPLLKENKTELTGDQPLP